jgi:nitrogen fixation NifU-like protein
MPYSDNKEQLYRDIILDHYNRPRNRGLVDATSYEMVHLKNPSCGDDLIVQIKRTGERIDDIRFTGEGCAICCASASMMSENLKGKTTREAKAIIAAFYAMVSGSEDIAEDILEEAISLQGVAKLPPRIKCASLGYKATEQILFKTDVNDTDIEQVK